MSKGAEPGDVLKVKINKIVPRAYATNFNVPGMFGQFPKHYQDGQVKYLYLDLDRMVTEFLPGVCIPLRPFPGTHRRRAQGARASTAPCRRANTPATWTSAIWSRARRSMFPCMCRARCCGPATPTPRQGNGEVNLTAIETAYREFNITVDVVKGSRSTCRASRRRGRGSPWASTRT